MHHDPTQGDRNGADHGPSLPLAQSEVGQVSMCACGVVTVTLHYISLRFEPAAFRELQGMLVHAQKRLDGDPGVAAARRPQPALDAPNPPVH